MTAPMTALMSAPCGALRRLAARVVALALGLAAPALAQPAADFQAIDALVAGAIAEHQLPGAVVLIGHGGRIVFERAYGHRALVPQVEAMSDDTIFDMASLTKCLATATALMQLHQQGLFDFDDPVARHLPAFAGDGKQGITIRELMTHYSGIPDADPRGTWSGYEEGLRRAFATPTVGPPGSVFRYSDLNFIALAALVEKLSGQTLDAYTLEHIYTPLGMLHTRFLPPAAWLPKIAPTEYDEQGRMMRGLVDDPTSRRMGGVAGHAGLFSTAGDVALYAQALLDGLAGRPSAFPLSRHELQLMTSPQQPAPAQPAGPQHRVYRRGVGWDIDSPYAVRGDPQGAQFGEHSCGHTGYTGTSLWIDPDSDSYVIVLANNGHPVHKGNITPLRRAIAAAAARVLGAAR